MSRIVFVLGAGASMDAGAPLMKDFIDAADELRKTDKVEKYHFDKVFNAKSKLGRIHSKSSLSLTNIENLFSAFEMARIINYIPGEDGQEIEKILVSVKHFIAQTLQNRILFSFDGKRLKPPEIYNSFAQLIKDINEQEFHSCSVITFNYDIALDYALFFNLCPPNYHLNDTNK